MIKNLDEIKAKSDIVDIISTFIPLKKAGSNYQAPCPFHNEKSASFIVSPQKQIFTCFGCGKGGDVIKFVQEYKSLSFAESIAEVAQMSGVELEYDTNTLVKTHNTSQLCEKYKSLLALAQKELLNKPQILEYLHKRGLENDDFAHFGIGFMPPLDKVREIFSTEEALSLGILKKRQDGAIYTPFKERIIFAIFDKNHKIVGLSGRTHPYGAFKNAPKYLNSVESFLFKKSQNLYLFSLAKTAIKSSQKAIIVEGYMDAIALHKLGYKNAVATCGTAFNLQHLNAIYRICQEVEFCLCFDSDEAGRKATQRAIELLFTHRFYNTRVLVIKEDYKDIGEILERKMELHFKDIYALKFFIAFKLKNAPNPRAKDEVIKELKALLENEQNYFMRSFLLDKIVEITQIPREFWLKNKAKAPQNVGEKRILKLLYSIYNNEDCAYLAKQKLWLEALPKTCQDDLNVFFADKTLTPQATQISLNENFAPCLDIDGFYKEMLQTNITQAKKDLNMAKIKKDLPQVLALSEYITKAQKEITNQDEIF